MRRLVGLLVVLLVCWLGLWAVASRVVPKVADKILAYAIPKVKQVGIDVDSVVYESIDVSPTLLGAGARGVSAVFDLAPTDDINLNSTFQARQVSMRLANPLQMRGTLDIDDFEVSFHATDLPRRLPFDRLTNASLHIEGLPLLSPRTAAVEIYDGLERLFFDNAQVGNFEFHGDVVMKVHDVTMPALLYTEQQQDQFRLRFSRADVQALVDAAEVKLSEEQIDIISLYPIRVPFLIEITREARALSKKSFPQDTWLRDALRHIAWSFLLAQEFGPEFAKEVTDAQETKAGNTANERSMDYHNNAVGRGFAGNSTRLADLPRLVRSHPDVIRHPDEVETRTELLR